MTRITLLAEENCASFALTGFQDAFATANFMWAFMGHAEPIFHLQTVTLDGQPVRASGGIEVHPQNSLKSLGETDLILLPAFLPPFDLETQRIGKLCDWLCKRYDQGNCLVTTCTGTFFMAKTGLLDGREATTNWLFANMFRRMHPRVSLRMDRMIVEDERLLTSGAATAFLNMCLHLIECYGSADLATQCIRALLIDPERKSQAPYMIHDFWKDHNDEEILAAQRFMEEHYAHDITVGEVAQKVGIGQRHFKRRFKQATGETPISYIQHLRIEDAKRQLEMTRRSVSEITFHVGYEDVNSFRRLFGRYTGMSPKGYREKYSRLVRPVYPRSVKS